jgi:UDP-2,3-diacylglucosamine pyrophosphatase LpxH
MRLCIISDLHVGAGPLDDCDEELEAQLVAFLDRLSAQPEPTVLVINGDFLDFVQAEPWEAADLESETDTGTPLCFTEEQSVEKLRRIALAHPAIFEALGRLVHPESAHRVLVLPGNHDPDFFWPQVRQEFVRTVARRGERDRVRLSFHLEQAYRPAGFAGLWIEHGHQYDDCNKFEVNGEPRWSQAAPPILDDHEGVPRLLECVGTRFLIKYLNGLDRDYPFVDNVKPFSKFVRLFLTSTVRPGFGPVRAAIAYWGFLKFFAKTLAKSPTDLLSSDHGKRDPKRSLRQFAARLRDIPSAEAELLAAELTQRGFDFEGRSFSVLLGDSELLQKLLDFLSSHPEMLSTIDAQDDDEDGLLSLNDPGSLTLGGGYLADETEALKEAASRLIVDRAAKAVVMGHTHEAVLPTLGLNYLNIGCWTRYLREAEQPQRLSSWSILKRQAYRSFPYELGYAEITAADTLKLVRSVFRA